MEINKELLLDMLSTPSVSGSEMKMGEKLYKYAETFAHQVRTDEIGDVVAVLNPDSSFRVMLSGHMDEIGLLVTAVTEDGFLRVNRAGGVYASLYPGHQVQVITEQGPIFGAVVFTRDLCKKEDLSPTDLYLDIGAKDREDALTHVALGDPVIFDNGCRELLNGRISGRGMDNRIGAFIVMEAVKKARELGCKVGVYGAATVGEETSSNGAYFVASRVEPTLAIAVDITYTSDYPGMDIAATGDVKVGGGPVLINNPSCHKKIQSLLRQAAEKQGISVQTEAASGRTGTDGDTILKTGKGVPFTCVSIPLRYIHSPSEVGCYADIQGCIDLLAQFLADLDLGLDLTWY